MNKMIGIGSGMGGFLPWFFGALIVLGIVIIGVVIVRLNGGAGLSGQGSARADHRTKKNGSARGILDERYARGELTTEEYLQRLMGLKEYR
jgi:putative membrane protein